MGSREEPGPTEVGSGISEVVGPVPPLILYNTTFVHSLHSDSTWRYYLNATNEYL